MSTKSPFDYSAFSKMFDPEEVKKYFDPTKMFAHFETPKAPQLDLSDVFETNRKNFEAMVEANKAAAAAYHDLMEKQMEVFGQITGAARDHVAWLEETAGPEALSKKTEAYGEAVEKALTLMKGLAENARDASEEAYAKLKDQVNEAVEEMKTKTQSK